MDSELQKISKANEELSNYVDVSVETLGSSYLESKRGTFVKLLDSDSYKYSITKKGKEIVFDQPVFLSTVSFISTSDKKRPKLNIQAKLIDNSIVDFDKLSQSSRAENRSFISIYSIVKSISLKTGNLLRNEEIKRIILIGLTQENFLEAIGKYNNFSNKLEDYKKEANVLLKKLESENELLDNKIEEYENEETERSETIKDLDSQISVSKKDLEQLTSDISDQTEIHEKLLKDSSNLQEKNKNLENSVAQLTQKNSNLNKSITDLSDDLEKLSSRKDLYTEDMKGLNSESSKQLNAYYILLGIALLSLSVIGYNAVEKINILINVYEQLKANNADTTGWDLVVMRLPYATIILAVISALTLFAQNLVTKILEINTQKREMIGLSLLARDITKSSSKGLDMSDDEIFKRRESLKFDLLSESILGSTFKSVGAKRKQSDYYDIPKSDDVGEEVPLQ